MRRKRKKVSFFLKAVLAVLAVYAAVTLVYLQIQINTQKTHQAKLDSQREELLRSNAALRSFTESDLDQESVAQIAREALGLVRPEERLIVDIGR